MAVCLGAAGAGTADAADPFTWTPSASVNGGVALTAISCPTESLCVAGDALGNILTSTDPTGGAAAWTSDNVAGSDAIMAISCPSASLCVAGDGAGNAYSSTDPAGSVWSLPTGINGTSGEIDALDCPTVTLCVAAGLGGNVITTTTPTGAWAAPVDIVPGTFTLFSMSCPSSALCVAGDDVGRIFFSTNPAGAAWSAGTSTAAGVIRAMSCPTATLCVGADDSSQVVTSTNPTGTALDWTVTDISNPGFVFHTGVSCPSPAICVAVDSTGSVRPTDNPTGGAAAWSGTDLATSALNGVSCPTVYLCVAVDNGGGVAFGERFQLNAATVGTGSGQVSGQGMACPPTCGVGHPAGTVVTLTATPAADGSTFDGWSGDCAGTGTCQVTMSAARSVTASFSAAAAPPADPEPVPVTTAQQPPGPTPIPPPVVARSANVAPVSGTVRVRSAGGTTFAPLTEPAQVRFGAIIDARKGRVRIVVANGRGGFDSAEFFEGMFKLVQARATRPVAELQLFGGSFRGCPKASRGGASAAAAPRGRSVRRLWGAGSGAFRTKGRHSAATIRGTTWLTDDRCQGTLTRVTKGSVTVRDLVRRKNVVLRATKSYFARARTASRRG